MTPKLFSRPSPSPPSPHKERPHNFQPPDKFFFFSFFFKGGKKKERGGKYLTKCLLHFTSPLQVTRFLSFILRATLFVFLFFLQIDTGPLLNCSPAQIRKPRCWCFSGFHFPSYLNTRKRATEVVYKGQSSRLRENVGHHMLAEDENKIDPLIS